MSLCNGDMVQSLDTLGAVGIVIDTRAAEQRVCVVWAWNFYTWPFGSAPTGYASLRATHKTTGLRPPRSPPPAEQPRCDDADRDDQRHAEQDGESPENGAGCHGRWVAGVLECSGGRRRYG